MKSRNRLLPLLGVLWAGVVLAGFGALTAFKSTPGAAAAPPPRWPDASALERAADRATLVLFAHPRCPCTRATIEELARLLSKLPARPRLYVLFLAGPDAEFTQTDLWKSATLLPGATVRIDEGKREAARFSASTSGTTLLYGVDGKLLFSGGLTSSRGHEGDSFGQRRILSLLTQGSADRNDSPVFGCALDDENRGGSP